MKSVLFLASLSSTNHWKSPVFAKPPPAEADTVTFIEKSGVAARTSMASFVAKVVTRCEEALETKHLSKILSEDE